MFFLIEDPYRILLSGIRMNFIRVNRLERYKGSLIEEALLHIYTSHKRDPNVQNPDSQLFTEA